MSVRVRFAPSPTGFLHIGSLRTALFTYLIAKSGGGKCILRIEDTDQEREVEGAVESLIEILRWVGIVFDEGPHVGGNYGPYTQTERVDIYDKYARILLEKDGAYRCFCTPERLKEMREEQRINKLPTRYDRRCRNLTDAEISERLESGEAFVIRQKMPLDGDVVVYDGIQGEIRFDASHLDDHVLVKSNGIPTYQFANVVDDHLMEITHVTRADEWIPSFPKNVLLYRAFGWDMPEFVHYPVILNKGGGKLSKRHGDVMVEEFRDKGYLPDALVNFCVLLGWHPKDDNEILSFHELERNFDMKSIGASAAIFDTDKLDYFNGYYIRHMLPNDLLSVCLPYLINADLIKAVNDDGFEIVKSGKVVGRNYLEGVVALEQERIKKISDVVGAVDFFFVDELEYAPELLIWKKMTAGEARTNLDNLLKILDAVPVDSWNAAVLEEVIGNHIKSAGLNVGSVLWPFRVSLTGRKASPGAFEVASVLGKEETLRRMGKAIKQV
ncbi:MAG: glutamate--tRNA ligase [Proteobacteria bacterium]|nr:glutamate--tRNA ligase [Pseudomonadota bacterium]